MLFLYLNLTAYNFISSLRNLYGNFWKDTNGYCQYYLKLDGYYFCPKNKKSIAVLRIRNKRTTDRIPVQEIVNDKEYLRELHPLDACILGLIANNERNGIINANAIGWRKMTRSKGYKCFTKSNTILDVSKKYINKDGVEIIVLYSTNLKREIEISAIDLCKNHALLYALGSFQALSLGYDISELFVRKHRAY